jgi:lipid-A-disaccharide synthase-like uncharacterized protein
MILGIIGLVLLAIGWTYEIVKIIKEKKSRIDLKFELFYTLGTIFLILYAIQIKDPIFIILKSIVLFLSVIYLYFSIKDTYFK